MPSTEEAVRRIIPAALRTVVIAGRPLPEYRPLDLSHPHRLDQLVGYVGYRTVAGGRVVEATAPAFVIEEPGASDGRYMEAVTLSRALWRDGEYWVIDGLYACGCRSY